MTLRPLLALPLMLAIAAPLPAAAAASTAESDARCVALLSQIMSKGTPEQQGAARLGTMFFIGKLRGRDPNVDFAAALRAGAEAGIRQKLAPQAEIQRCGAEVSSAAQALRQVKPMAPPPKGK